MRAGEVPGYYREQSFNRLALVYDTLTCILGFFLGGERRLRRRIVILGGLRPGDRVLDVGCGTGTMAVVMGEVVGPEGQIVGVDLSPRMIAIAQRKAAGPQVSFRVADAGELPYPDESFDKVTITYALHEMPRPARQDALREARRVLKRGGRLIVVDYHEPSSWFRHTMFRVLMLVEGATARDLLVNGLLKEIRDAGFVGVRQVFVVNDFIPLTLALKSSDGARARAPWHDASRQDAAGAL